MYSMPGKIPFVKKFVVDVTTAPDLEIKLDGNILVLSNGQYEIIDDNQTHTHTHTHKAPVVIRTSTNDEPWHHVPIPSTARVDEIVLGIVLKECPQFRLLHNLRIVFQRV